MEISINNNSNNVQYFDPISLRFNSYRDLSTGQYYNLGRDKKILTREYIVYISDIESVESLHPLEILELAKNYISLKKKVDKYNNNLEIQKIK